MRYEEKDFSALESALAEFAADSLSGKSMIGLWREKCNILFISPERSTGAFLKYADARKLLIRMLQNLLVSLKGRELDTACELIMQLLAFSDHGNEQNMTWQQKSAWLMNHLLKKYNFAYWETFLRESGEDETDVVRKIYRYLQKWENRIEAADTLYEYLENNTFPKEEAEKIIRCIKNLEDNNKTGIAIRIKRF